MYMIEISALPNGAHRNQTFNGVLPDGWAIIPKEMETTNFPFGEVVAEKIDGMMVVTGWLPGIMPEIEPDVDPVVEPSFEDDTSAMLVDHEYRLTLLELGISEF